MMRSGEAADLEQSETTMAADAHDAATILRLAGIKGLPCSPTLFQLSSIFPVEILRKQVIEDTALFLDHGCPPGGT